MSGAQNYQIQGINLMDNKYTVQQGFIRNKYKAMDRNGNVVLRGKQKMFKMKEEFPFVDANGNEVFTVKAGGIMDIAGDYTLTDAATGQDLVVLDNDFSLFQDTWRIRDAQTEQVLAEINSQGAMVSLARNYLGLLSFLIPYKYEITDNQGQHVGQIKGQIALKDTFDVTIDDASNVPQEPIVAAAMVIDAIQNR